MTENSLRSRIVQITAATEPNLSSVTQKELLHAEILALMHRHNMLETLTFSDGTALRLCYGSLRLSEDLDFVSSKTYTPELLKDFAEYARSHFQALGIDVSIKEPKVLSADSPERNNFDHINVDLWQISFSLMPERRDIPRPKIKLEITTVPTGIHP